VNKVILSKKHSPGIKPSRHIDTSKKERGKIKEEEEEEEEAIDLTKQ
jgi:hypothetical protein